MGGAGEHSIGDPVFSGDQPVMDARPGGRCTDSGGIGDIKDAEICGTFSSA